MGTKTGIEWTDATWNPIRGCSRVSEGCRNCYAESVAYRFSGPGQPYEGLVTIGADGERKRQWNGLVRVVEEHLRDPLKWKAPRRIFVNSMSDLFHPNVPDEWIDRIFAVMALCPQHTFQILTKRPERMLRYFSEKHRNPQGWPKEDYDAQACIRLSLGGLLGGKKLPNGCPDMKHFLKSGKADRYGDADRRLFYEWPLKNVWLGVSVEDQKTADERIPLLLQTPAAVRFISAEPLLGAVDLRSTVGGTLWIGGQRGCDGTHHGIGTPECPRALHHHHDDRCRRGLDWVICGGESGPGARPMHPDWARSLRDQCVAAKVPFFFKQWGEWLGAMQDGVQVLNCTDKPQRVGKKAAGALLDGREWKEFPEVPK